LRLRITGQGPAAYQPQRDRLRILPPKLYEDFYVEQVPAEDQANPSAGTWDFVYRLRPKHAGAHELNGLKLVYYDPARRRYQTAYQEPDSISLTVKPRPEPSSDWDVPSRVPASFFELVPIPLVSARPATTGISVIVLGILLPPLACWLGSRLLRRTVPAAGPSRAVEQARQELSAGRTPPWAVMACYLRQRLGYAGTEPTPVDMARLLKRRGFAAAVIAAARDFEAACDAARFAPVRGSDHGALRDRALHLVQAMESDKCLA
jgi:hypothetical protein